VGENPPTRANRKPTPGISPKWVNRLFFTVPRRDKDDVSHIICVRSGLAHRGRGGKEKWGQTYTWRAREREPIMGVWGGDPSGGPGAEPPVAPYWPNQLLFNTNRYNQMNAQRC